MKALEYSEVRSVVVYEEAELSLIVLDFSMSKHFWFFSSVKKTHKQTKKDISAANTMV